MDDKLEKMEKKAINNLLRLSSYNNEGINSCI